MEKKNKITLANWLIKCYLHFASGLMPKSELSPESEFKHIAIYSTTALGDLMFNTPAIHQLRLRYPSACLTLVAHKKYRMLLQGYADVDRVCYWDGRFASLFGCVRRLRRSRVDLAVILHSRAPYDVMCAVFSGARAILRDDNFSRGEVPMNRWLAAASESAFSGHVIQRKLNLLSVLGCRTDMVEMVPPCSVNRSRYDSPGIIRVGYQLGASSAERCWPISSFVALTEMLLETHAGVQIVLLGSPQEMPLKQAFYAQLNPRFLPSVVSLLGETNMRDAFDAVASLDVLVTGDTGPLHLALALKVPTVSLFATANPAATGPYQNMSMHTVIYRPLDKESSGRTMEFPLSSIQPVEVFAEVLKVYKTVAK